MTKEEIKLNILIDKGSGHLFSLHERKIIFAAMDEYLSLQNSLKPTRSPIEKISGSEPEGKEAVEFTEWVRLNYYLVWDEQGNPLWEENVGGKTFTTEQLYKIWKNGS